MLKEVQIVEEPKKMLSMHPKKFAMWLFLVSVVMLFAALTSAYIVKKAGGGWLVFELPPILWVNSGVIIISSLTMHWAYRSAKRDNLDVVKMAISLTTFLGITFLIGQFIAWGQLVEHDVYFVGNPAGSFVYVLTGMHGLHLISGIIFLIVVLVSTYKFKVHSRNMLKMELCTTYWHFLGALWLYLYIFLLLN